MFLFPQWARASGCPYHAGTLRGGSATIFCPRFWRKWFQSNIQATDGMFERGKLAALPTTRL